MPYAVGVFVALGVTLALVGADVEARRQQRILSVVVLLAVSALVGAKLYSAAERGGFVWQDPPWEIASGYRYPGAMIAVLVMSPFLWRVLRPGISVRRFLDAGVLGVCAAMVVIRLRMRRRKSLGS